LSNQEDQKLAIKFAKPTLRGLFVVGSCDQNTLISLQLTVTGTGAVGDKVDVKIFEASDTDDPIHTVKGAAIAKIRPGKKFVKVLSIKLSCDDDCYVRGNEETSSESDASVFAVVSDPLDVATEMKSGSVSVECVGSTTALIDPHGTHLDRHAQLSIAADKGAVDRKVSLRIDFNPDPPETAYFPSDIDTDASLIKIGEPFIDFCAPTKARWNLTPETMRRLTDGDGSVISYDPCTQDWTPVEGASIDGDAVIFPVKTTGLYGVASRAKLKKTAI